LPLLKFQPSYYTVRQDSDVDSSHYTLRASPITGSAAQGATQSDISFT